MLSATNSPPSDEANKPLTEEEKASLIKQALDFTESTPKPPRPPEDEGEAILLRLD